MAHTVDSRRQRRKCNVYIGLFTWHMRGQGTAAPVGLECHTHLLISLLVLDCVVTHIVLQKSIFVPKKCKIV